MASRKITIHLHDSVVQRLRMDGDASMSVGINSRLSRYADVVEQHAPPLTEAEWSAVMECLSGVDLLATIQQDGDNADLPHWLHVEMRDANLGEKWGIDSPALEALLAKLPYAGKVAIVEIASRFWRHPQLNELSTRELLLACGARIAD